MVYFSIRLPHHGACLQQPCCCFIAGYGGNFRKFLPSDRRQLKSFSLHPRKQRPSSPLCISLSKRWVSGRPLHDTPFLDLESELCASQTIGSHPKLTHRWWAPHHATIACTLRRHFISYLTRWCWLARRQASCMRDGTLYSGSRKESTRTKAESATTEGGAGQIYCAVHLWSTKANGTATRTHTLIGRPRSRLRGWESIKNRD